MSFWKTINWNSFSIWNVQFNVKVDTENVKRMKEKKMTVDISIYLCFFLLLFHHRHRITTAVYQVTRPGHEHCDATEGILLDITPLVVDGKKLVTLYDKDLTEGVNLLIGM